ncbi:MAG: hypothetical protein RR501_12460 [Cloacibacillus sp.]
MTYSNLESVLNGVLPNLVYKWKAPRNKPRYIVWTPTGANTVYGDDTPILHSLRASVYIYTQTDDDHLPADVFIALIAAGISAGEPMPGYLDDELTEEWVIETELC